MKLNESQLLMEALEHYRRYLMDMLENGNLGEVARATLKSDLDVIAELIETINSK